MIHQTHFPVYLTDTVRNWHVDLDDDDSFYLGDELYRRSRNSERFGRTINMTGEDPNGDRRDASIITYLGSPVPETNSAFTVTLTGGDDLLPDLAVHTHVRSALEDYIGMLGNDEGSFVVDTVWIETFREGLEPRLVLGFLINHADDPENYTDVNEHIFGLEDAPGSVIHPSAIIGQSTDAHRQSTSLNDMCRELEGLTGRTIALHSQSTRLNIQPIDMRYMLKHFPDAYHILAGGCFVGGEAWSHGASLHESNYNGIEWFGTRAAGPATMAGRSIVGTPDMQYRIREATQGGGRQCMLTPSASQYPNYPYEQVNAMAAYFCTPHIATLRNAGGFPYAVIFQDFAIIPAVPYHDSDELIEDMRNVLVAKMATALAGGATAETTEAMRERVERYRRELIERRERERIEAEERQRAADFDAIMRFAQEEQTTILRNTQVELDRSITQIETTRRILVGYVREREELTQKLEGVRRAAANNDLAETQALYMRVLESPKIKRIIAQHGHITAHTHHLLVQDDRTRVYHSLGECSIVINTADGNITYDTSERISGVWNRQRAPHVNGDGHACGGTFDQMAVELAAARDWPSLIFAAIAFLETANTLDGAGAYVYKFPVCEEPDEHGYPAYDDEFDPHERVYNP